MLSIPVLGNPAPPAVESQAEPDSLTNKNAKKQRHQRLLGNQMNEFVGQTKKNTQQILGLSEKLIFL